MSISSLSSSTAFPMAFINETLGAIYASDILAKTTRVFGDLGNRVREGYSSLADLTIACIPCIINPTSASSVALKEAIDAFIEELDTQCRADTGKGFGDEHYNHACELLKQCTRIAGTNLRHISQIKQALDDYNFKIKDYGAYQEDNLLNTLIENEHPSLAHLLIDLKIKEIYDTEQNSPLHTAVQKGNKELVSHLLKVVHPDKNTRWGGPLYNAVKLGDKECIRLLLEAGADPNLNLIGRTSPFEMAVVLGDISLLPLFFSPKICRFKPDTSKALETLSLIARIHGESNNVKRYALIDKFDIYEIELQKKERIPLFNGLEHRIARALPPIVEKISCFTPYVAGREKIVKKFIDPLLTPPTAINELISPLKAFLFKESQEDPRFTITISPNEGWPQTIGNCYSTGNIDLYLPKDLRTLNELSEAPIPTLLHETCHKALNNIYHGDKAFVAELRKHVVDDFKSLCKENWKHCHLSVSQYLKDVFTTYNDRNQVIEEHLVRVPEIIYAITQEDPTRSLEDIEKILQRDIPNTYKYYKETFLPALVAYNSSPTSKK